MMRWVYLCHRLANNVCGSGIPILHWLQTTFKVQVSYYEIYKEKIFDLLASTKHKSKTKVISYLEREKV